MPVEGFAHSDRFESPHWTPASNLILRNQVLIGQWELAESTTGALVFIHGTKGKPKVPKLVVSGHLVGTCFKCRG